MIRLHSSLQVCLLAGSLVWTVNLAAEPALPSKDRLQSSPVLRHLRPNPVAAAPRTPAEETVAQMYVPEGFRVSLIASEPEVHQPIAFAFDDRGRLWVAEGYSYPTKRPAGKGQDRLVIFEDKNGDGQFESKKVFIEGLNLVSGFELGYGGVWVGAAPELLFIPDQNHDDVPDAAPEVLLDGFGYQDTHECLNSFLWGPDGWLYGNQGVFNLAYIGKPGSPKEKRTELRAGVWRYHPIRREFEIFAHGGSNPWGLDYDDEGQLFMTHCRSYFGRGCTTHVLPGGVFWNQSNANYPPYVLADPPEGFPQLQNYLLASARYDHGAGGAGVQGSDAIYGGHSHVGTLIYLGDNWPDAYRGHVFTHNLGGHQINHQINERLGSGYNTVHSGKDQLFCTDPRYVPVDLQTGPDGAVYVIDWYDLQHCHNPNTERWDRSNGRIYRIDYASTYRPVHVDLGRMSDDDLVGLFAHKNRWYGRTAQRLLTERANAHRLAASTSERLRQEASGGKEAITRLHALWALYGIESGATGTTVSLLKDSDAAVRAWAVRFVSESASKVPRAPIQLAAMAKSEPAASVRLALASAALRLPDKLAWQILETLSGRAEDAEDRHLPTLLWQGIARRMATAPARALEIAKSTPIPLLADWIYWYAARSSDAGLTQALESLNKAQGDSLRRRMAVLVHALGSRGNLTTPPALWGRLSSALYANPDPQLRRQAEYLGVACGDRTRFAALRASLANPSAEAAERQHAFRTLGRALDTESLPSFLPLLEDAAFRARVIPIVARFGDPRVADSLIRLLESWPLAEQQAALNALTSRPSFGLTLIEAVQSGKVKRDRLTSFHLRRLQTLDNPELQKRLAAVWGRMGSTSAEKQARITTLEKTVDEAPLWAYDGRAGQQQFMKLCSQCHRIGNDGARIGPELTGAGKHGTRYLVENIIDPNAVIGADFQVTTLETKQGEVISGLVTSRSPESVTLRTTAEQVVIARKEIVKESTSENSLMPEGLLDSLSEREQIELIKYLREH